MAKIKQCGYYSRAATISSWYQRGADTIQERVLFESGYQSREYGTQTLIMNVWWIFFFSDINQTNVENDNDNGITYDPTPYDQLGLRVGTPPPDWKDNVENVEPTKKTENKEDTSKPPSAATTSNNVDSRTALRRRQFASRRESVRGLLLLQMFLKSNFRILFFSPDHWRHGDGGKMGRQRNSQTI